MNLIEVRLNADITIGIHQAAPNEPVSILEIKNDGSFRGITTLTPEAFAEFLVSVAQKRRER